MPTMIEIDDALLAAAKAASGLATDEVAVEAALRLLISSQTKGLAELDGIGWDGDPDAMRELHCLIEPN